jgi:hypothetical protein
MYEYGCFLSFWSSFETMVEIAIAERSGMTDATAHIVLSSLNFSAKSEILCALLKRSGEERQRAALSKVASAVKRNDLVHGTVLNPKGDFSEMRLLTRRVKRGYRSKNTLLDPNSFAPFYKALCEFEEALSISKERGNAYLSAS